MSIISNNSMDSRIWVHRLMDRITSIRLMWIISGAGSKPRLTSNFPFGCLTKRWEGTRSHKMALMRSCCLPISYHHLHKFGDVLVFLSLFVTFHDRFFLYLCLSLLLFFLYISHVYHSYLHLLATSFLTCLSCITRSRPLPLPTLTFPCLSFPTLFHTSHSAPSVIMLCSMLALGCLRHGSICAQGFKQLFAGAFFLIPPCFACTPPPLLLHRYHNVTHVFVFSPPSSPYYSRMQMVITFLAQVWNMSHMTVRFNYHE